MNPFSYVVNASVSQPNAAVLQYNTTVFSVSGLSNSQHELVISTINPYISGYINFDYAIYTYVYSMIAPSSCGSNYVPGPTSPIIRPCQLLDL
jgi:hypothetical protein